VWAGYPLWSDLADKMHSIYSREERAYNKKTSSQLLKGNKYPDLFEQMRIANQQRYFSLLSGEFGPKRSNSVYLRFTNTLRKLSTISIITTNVDEALEHNLPDHETVQRSDIERVSQLLYSRTPFICKLHGSASSVETMVFSAKDYEAIQQNYSYVEAVKSIFSNATVLFLGYSLRDKYVLQCLETSTSACPLFGTGPHFVVTAEKRLGLQKEIQYIQYDTSEHTDHRGAITVLEIISDFISKPTVQTHCHDEKYLAHESLYFISHLYPEGVWKTSQIATVKFSSGKLYQMIAGEGYVNTEIEHYNYSALHDIAVGLLCFDIVCVLIGHLAAMHNLLGSEAFWLFVKSGSLRVVIPPEVPVILFDDDQSHVGKLDGINLVSKESLSGDYSPIPLSISEHIRKQLVSVEGEESKKEELFLLLEQTVIDLSKSQLSGLMLKKTLSTLMNPLIRKMLGVSNGTPRNVIPRWLAHPILRLAKVINCGVICQRIQASSTRMIFGSEMLASAAFSAIEGKEWADNAASYVLTGRFNSDIGSIIKQDRSLLLGILNFRESSAGEEFRREVTERLAAGEGSEIVTAINAGLKQAIPPTVLQKAHDQMSGLFTTRNRVSAYSPAVWGDLRNSDKCIANWRKHSLNLLKEEIKRQKLEVYNDCPCGSGERLKFCCLNALG